MRAAPIHPPGTFRPDRAPRDPLPMAIEKRPLSPIARYLDGTYQMPEIAKNNGRPWMLYRVRDGDTWISIAQRDGWANALDFIEANLRTRDSGEINWYLREYIGCHVQDAKRDNYGFSSTATPGLIWTRGPLGVDTPNLNLFKNVLAALNFRFYPLFHFQIRGWTLPPFLFDRVSNYVARGLIKVRYEAKAGPDQGDGEYASKSDTLYLRRLDQGLETRALIVHEAVHAGFDLLGNPMIRAYSEAFAYVAQCLYYQLIAGHELGPGNSGDAAEAAIFEAANKIANEIYHAYVARMDANKDPSTYRPWTGFQVPEQYADPLLLAINGYPRYKGSLREQAEYDGIPDAYGDR